MKIKLPHSLPRYYTGKLLWNTLSLNPILPIKHSVVSKNHVSEKHDAGNEKSEVFQEAV